MLFVLFYFFYPLIDSELKEIIGDLFEVMNDKKVETKQNKNVLPIENRILLGSVLQMLHDAFSKHDKQSKESRFMAATLDSMICPVNPEVRSDIQTAKAQGFPVLRHMIEAWGGAVILDSDYNFIDRWEQVYELFYFTI